MRACVKEIQVLLRDECVADSVASVVVGESQAASLAEVRRRAFKASKTRSAARGMALVLDLRSDL